ncbi:MAG: hypothetical protein ACRC5G_05665, partial [Cetobacterium sp.]
TIHDELPYKIVTRDGRRYLEISYSKEPEKIYLWVLKNDKVQKLYTGIFKEIKITTRADGAFEIFSSVNSNNQNFSLSFTKTGVESGDNLYGGTGKLNAWETTKNNNSVKITAFFHKNNIISSKHMGDVSLGKTNNVTFKHDELDFNFNYKEDELLKPVLKIKNYDFDKIVIQFDFHNGPHTGSGKEGTDILTINFRNTPFTLEATDMNFGEINHLSTYNAESVIKVIGDTSLDYSIDFESNRNLTNSNNEVINFNIARVPFDESGNFKLMGTILPRAEEYSKGSYTGTIPVTVTVIPKKRGGRF